MTVVTIYTSQTDAVARLLGGAVVSENVVQVVGDGSPLEEMCRVGGSLNEAGLSFRFVHVEEEYIDED